MSAYKVNFKKFVSVILENELPTLSKHDDTVGLTLAKFMSKHSIDMFLQNTEKHFRMQFVIELVSSLVTCLHAALASKTKPVPAPVNLAALERSEMQLEDLRSSLVREEQRLKSLMIESHKNLMLQKLEL